MKAQAAFESMIVLAVILILFVCVFYFNQNTVASIRYNKEVLAATEIAENIAWSINAVSIAGDGTFLAVYLPNTQIGGGTYNLTVLPEARLAEIRWANKHYTVPLMTKRIVGDIYLFSGTLNITNEEGEVILEQ